eukprot:NODE_313_length_11219_cov_0.287770.p3 type:complete len:409 gc:universal NODE_313_length_11219_cov_0.287770:730-1956(+)
MSENFSIALLSIFASQVPGIIFWIKDRKHNHYSTRLIWLTFTLYVFLFLVLIGCLFTNWNFDANLPCGVLWLMFYCSVPAFILLTYRTLLFVLIYKLHNPLDESLTIGEYLNRFFSMKSTLKSASLHRNSIIGRKTNGIRVGWKQYLIVLQLSFIVLILMFIFGLLIVGPEEMFKYPTESSICDYRMSIVLVSFTALCFIVQGYCMFLIRNCKDGLGIKIELMVMFMILLPTYLVFGVFIYLSSNKQEFTQASYIGLVPTFVLMSLILYFPFVFMFISTWKLKSKSKTYLYPYFELTFKEPAHRTKMEQIARKRLCSELMNFMNLFDEMEKEFQRNGLSKAYKDIGSSIITKYLIDQSDEQVCLNEDVILRILQVPSQEQIPFDHWLVAKKDVLYMIYENIYKYYVED